MTLYRTFLSIAVAAVVLAAPVARAQATGELHHRAATGDVTALETLLLQGAEVDARDEHGRTPLIAAAQQGSKACVLVLLARGANIEAIDEHGYTPLIWAAQQGHTVVVAALLARGADLMAREKHDYTALEWAAWAGHVDAVRVLLAYGADPTRRTRFGFTAEQLAERQGNVALAAVFRREPVRPALPIVQATPPVAVRTVPPAPASKPIAPRPPLPETTWREVGRSKEGQPLQLAALGSGPRGVLFIGSIHGDEPQGTDMIYRLLREVPKMPTLLAGNRLLAIPNANPDGVSRRIRTNLGGVDLNRNFPTRWKPTARGRYFSGPRPLSEPESQALHRVIEIERPQLIVSFHAHMACNNFDGAAAEPVARAMSRLNGYRLLPQIGYETPGSLGQHAAVGLGIPIVTLEVGFETPEQLWRKVRDSLLVALTPHRL